MLYKFRILLPFIIAFQSCVFAQEVKKDTIPETKGEKAQEKKPYSVSQFAHETFLFIKQPLAWDGYDWLKVGIVTAATISLMPFDERIANSSGGNQRYYYYSAPIVGGRVYGEWYSIGGVAGAFGLYGLIAHDSAAKRIGLELLQAGLFSELVTEVFKNALGRARPYTNEGAFSYHPFRLFNIDFNSIPSGHTTSAMALSTVLSRHAHSTILKILAYVPAGLTMFSRIYQNQHWLSDVVPAAAIGYFAGTWVVNLHEGKRHRINVTLERAP
jgi:membrane-associated phospholipid phosphatase